MIEPTKTKREWLPALKLMVIAYLMLLQMGLAIGFAVLFVTNLRSPWVQGIASVVLGLIALAIGFTGLAVFCIGVFRWALLDADIHEVSATHATLQEANRLLTSIGDRLLISDTAKRIAYRERDRDAMRMAIREDIAKGEFHAAMALVEQMTSMYGFHEEAEEFREQIQSARAAEMEAKIGQALGRFEEILKACEWDKASAEAGKIQRRFPDSSKVKNLAQRVVDARQQYKESLEHQFLEAAKRDDVDLAIELLKELDKYLTEAEAEPFRETARAVIARKRDNLGMQFKLAIQDREWPVSVRVGEQIIREYPNSKMADEVRDMLDVLRERATAQPPPPPEGP